MMKNIIRGIKSKPYWNFCTKVANAPGEGLNKFKNRLNTIDNEEFKTFEEQLDKFNEKVFKQNSQLADKILWTLQEDKANAESQKIFTIVNEINSVNISNTSQLLHTFLNQILKYNDSVRIFIQQQNKNKDKQTNLLPIVVIMLFLCGSVYLYITFKENNLDYNSLVQDLQKMYMEDSFKTFKLNSALPIYEDHKNITNSISFSNGNNHIVLIGPGGMGKTEAIKHFCLAQNLKDNMTIYVDLNDSTGLGAHWFKEKVANVLLANYHGQLNDYNRKFLDRQLLENCLFESLMEKKVCFVFDNYSHQRDSSCIFDNTLPFVKKNTNWKTLILSSNNDVYSSAIQNDLDVKYANFLQTRSFKSYLIEKVNSYCKKKPDYSGIEFFNEENMSKYYSRNYFMSYEDLIYYAELNGNFDTFYRKKEDKMTKKLKLLKLSDKKTFDALKVLIGKGSTFEWQKIPKGVDEDSLIQLEKSRIIFTKDKSEFVFLSKFDDVYDKVNKLNLN